MKRLLTICMAFMVGICFAGIAQKVAREYGREGEARERDISAADGRSDSGDGRETDENGKVGGYREEALIPDFPILEQMPELPTGCEITALTMMLEYYGYDADKTEMAREYLPKYPAEFWTGSDGREYGPDMERFFVGDPATSHGYICGTGAIRTAADHYLTDCKSRLRAADMTGEEPEDLYSLVSGGTPVLVWVTIGMEDRKETGGWYTKNGEYMEWSTNDHGAVLIGYGRDTVTIADPISGRCEYDKEQFEKVFRSRGNKCVILWEKQQKG